MTNNTLLDGIDPQATRMLGSSNTGITRFPFASSTQASRLGGLQAIQRFDGQDHSTERHVRVANRNQRDASGHAKPSCCGELVFRAQGIDGNSRRHHRAGDVAYGCSIITSSRSTRSSAATGWRVDAAVADAPAAYWKRRNALSCFPASARAYHAHAVGRIRRSLVAQPSLPLR